MITYASTATPGRRWKTFLSTAAMIGCKDAINAHVVAPRPPKPLLGHRSGLKSSYRMKDYLLVLNTAAVLFMVGALLLLTFGRYRNLPLHPAAGRIESKDP